MDCSPPGCSVHEVHQARTLEWVAIPFSRGSSRPGDRTQASYTAGGFLTAWAAGNRGRFFSHLLSEPDMYRVQSNRRDGVTFLMAKIGEGHLLLCNTEGTD